MTTDARPILIAAAFAVMWASVLTGDALAWKQVQDEWQRLYLTDHPDETFVTLCKKKAKCHVCHQGKSKKHNNPYGELFSGKITKEDRKDTEKISRVIQEIGRLRSTPNDEKSPTFEQLIAKSKLPGGDLKSVKREPPKEPAP